MEAIANGHGSGAAVAIMVKRKTVFSEGMGVRDWSLNNPVDSHTRFNIGSTSKMFVAVATLMLVDEGKVSLDESVASYIPDFKMKDQRYKDITVRMLVNHSSGLPGSSFYIGYSADYNSHELLLQTLAGEHLKHKPGACCMYCNDGLTLAEILVERVSGKKYMDFLKERIFDPLAMHDSGASVGELPGSNRNVAEYFDVKTGKRYPAEVLEVYGASGLSSTVEDLCRFGNSFTPYGKKLLSEASLTEIRSTQPTTFSNKLRHRQMWSEFGWDYSSLSPFDKKGIQVMAKGGNTLDYSTNLQILPDQGLVISLCISGGALAEALTRPILNGLLEDQKQVQREDWHPSKPVEAQRIPADLMKFAGFYAGVTRGAVKVVIRGDRKQVTLLPLEINDKSAKPLATLIYHDGTLWDRDQNLSCYFTTVEGKNYIAATPSVDGSDDASIYAADSLMFQQLDKIQKPASLQVDVNGKRWLVRNAPPSVLAKSIELVMATSTFKGLDGYVDFAGIKKIESPTFASIAATYFRDQSEVNLLKKKGTLWAQVGTNLYSPIRLAGKARVG